MGSKDMDSLSGKPGVYEVLRELHLSDGGTYPVQMELKSGIGEEFSEKIIERLEEKGIVYQVEGTDPQLFDINYPAFEDFWRDLWSKHIEEVPLTPVNFTIFIEKYVRAYIEEIENSSIDEMLVTEFYFGLIHSKDKRLPESYIELSRKIEEQFGGRNNSTEFIKAGLTKID